MPTYPVSIHAQYPKPSPKRSRVVSKSKLRTINPPSCKSVQSDECKEKQMMPLREGHMSGAGGAQGYVRNGPMQSNPIRSLDHRESHEIRPESAFVQRKSGPIVMRIPSQCSVKAKTSRENDYAVIKSSISYRGVVWRVGGIHQSAGQPSG